MGARRAVDIPVVALAVLEQHHLVIRGAVDGVAFRVWILNVARTMQITGEARFPEPGVCEVVAQGGRFALRQFAATCRRGPSAGVVASVSDAREPIEKHLFEFAMPR